MEGRMAGSYRGLETWSSLRMVAHRGILGAWLVLSLGAACGKPVGDPESTNSPTEGRYETGGEDVVDSTRDTPTQQATAALWSPPRLPAMMGVDGALQRLAEGDIEGAHRRWMLLPRPNHS